MLEQSLQDVHYPQLQENHSLPHQPHHYQRQVITLFLLVLKVKKEMTLVQQEERFVLKLWPCR